MVFITELLFYENPYKVDFTASVLSVEKIAGKENGYEVILDKTCFYPEGGGQPSDTGLIDGIIVDHVYKKEGIILHRMITSPEKGKVKCSIDWEHRLDYMQQHTGQHIISGALYKLGYGTISVHQGMSITTIEIDKADISENDLNKTEELSNEIISNNLPVLSEWKNDTDLDGLSLRRKPKVTGQIRIVSIDNFDKVACGGVHTGSTGEIQCVKYVSIEKIRGHARISWKIGNRVLRDYKEKISIVSSLSSTFSARQSEILLKVDEMLNSFQEHKRLNKQLEERLISFRIKEMFNKTEKVNNVFFITHVFENESKDFLRNFVNSIKTDDKFLICLINKTDSNFQWILASSGIDYPFSQNRQNLLYLINARGGGKAPVWQGIGNKEEGIEYFFEALGVLLFSK
jgi:alanyl-tRNA synthetase